MADFCTCGAELPPDARFCHKCGKPQREELNLEQEEVVPEVETLPPLPEARPVLAIPEVGFHNPLAVRVGVLAGGVAFLVLPIPLPAQLILLTGVGFLSAYLYQRRSGHPLSARNGARIGWMSGLFCFVIVMLFITIGLALYHVVSREAGMAAFFDRARLRAMGVPEQNIRVMIQMFENPWQVGAALCVQFALITGLLTLGGALGARLLRRD